MNYLAARRAELLFAEYRRLALEFWNAEQRDVERARQLREKLNSLLYSVNTSAALLNAGATAHQLAPLAWGGGQSIPVNFLRAVVEPEQGYGRVSHTRALDAIDRCIGAAQYHRRKAFWRLVNPLCWFVDVPVALARLPFLIMRKAGVPPSIEENIVSQIIKIIVAVAVFGLATYFGIKVTLGDVLKLW